MGLTNVECKSGVDAENLVGFADGSVDVVTISYGLQVMPDWRNCIREVRRVLKAGGTLAIAVWGPREKACGSGRNTASCLVHLTSPYLPLVPQAPFPRFMDDVNAAANPGVKRALNPFTFGDPTELLAFMREGGFEDVVLDEITSVYRGEAAKRHMFITGTGTMGTVKALEAQGRTTVMDDFKRELDRCV